MSKNCGISYRQPVEYLEPGRYFAFRRSRTDSEGSADENPSLPPKKPEPRGPWLKHFFNE